MDMDLGLAIKNRMLKIAKYLVYESSCIHRIERRHRWPNVIIKSQGISAILTDLRCYVKTCTETADKLRVAIAFGRIQKIMHQMQ